MDKLRALILRHGDTELNDANAFRGMLDPHLNDKGLLDAAKASQFLKQHPIERVMCSPLLRAVQTAEIASGALGGLHVCQTRELFPWQLGTDFYGKDRNEMGDQLQYYVENPYDTPKNGESLDDLRQRVKKFFEYQLTLPSLTLFVCHTSNIVTLNSLLSDESASPENSDVVGPGGVVAVYIDADGYRLEPVFGQEIPAEMGAS